MSNNSGSGKSVKNVNQRSAAAANGHEKEISGDASPPASSTPVPRALQRLIHSDLMYKCTEASVVDAIHTAHIGKAHQEEGKLTWS